MKSASELKKNLAAMDHKSYSLYKGLLGEYQFDNYILCIDKVQGDPFAAPSRVRVKITGEVHKFPQGLYDEKCKKTALEDGILRKWNRYVHQSGRRNGSGNSGTISVCHCGQEVVERIAVVFNEKYLEGRFLVGFPAKGRSILAGELEQILFQYIPKMVEEVFCYNSYDKKRLEENMELAVDQAFIRTELQRRDLISFLADGSILPRESGVSDRPLKEAVPFLAPDSLKISMDLPYGGRITGMGIPKGVTVIVGGGYHGKSTLLQAIQLGVYNHVKGDGREYVITDETAMKIRAEDGRSICNTDIHMFIDHLPNHKNTRHFYTENASGSTSQAANMVEALEAGTKTFLMDEDTSATNFMVRDGIMEQIVVKEKEPITPFISWVRALYEEKGISTVVVVGSSASYLEVADTVLQLDFYQVRDIKEKVQKVLGKYPKLCTEQKENVPEISFKRVVKKIDLSYKGRDMKVKTTETDTILFNKEAIDVRYLEQMVDRGQTVGIAYLLKYAMEHFVDNEKSMTEIVDEIYKSIEKCGYSSLVPKGYSAGFAVLPRKQEVMAAWNRFRKLEC